VYDYAEPYRAQILDAAFKRGAGAALHMLKVEIGGDTQSTEGTEPSHMRTRDDGDLDNAEAYNRGWEWWLLNEAKKRNPDLITMALSWGVPGWIGNKTVDAYWSEDNIDYHVRWVRGLHKHHGIQLDWMGVWNEVADANTDEAWEWIVRLRAALDNEPDGVGKHVKLVANDCTSSSNVCTTVLSNATRRAAIAGVANHYSWLSHAPSSSCQKLREEHGIPLMVTEGSVADGTGLNEAYALGNVSLYSMWPFIPAW
jgi:O-glycosyl hydrolase